jgi:hypothetical protein
MGVRIVVVVVEGARSTTSTRPISPAVIVMIMVRGVGRGTGIALS